jgi:hypothetical protein
MRKQPSRTISVQINENKPIEALIRKFRVFEGFVQPYRKVKKTARVTLNVRIRTIEKGNIIDLGISGLYGCKCQF